MYLFLIFKWLYKKIIFLYLAMLVVILWKIAKSSHMMPGILTRCDKHVVCDDFTKRDQISLEFLCCEGEGWPASHTTNPLGIGFFFGSPFVQIFFIVINEVWEAMAFLFIGGYGFLPSRDRDRETIAGIVLSDMFIQGGLGVVIAQLMRRYFQFPRLFPTIPKNVSDREHIKVFEKILLFFILYSASYGLFFWQVDVGFGGDRKFNSGVFFVTLFQLFLILFLIPKFTCSKNDEKYIWVSFF